MQFYYFVIVSYLHAQHVVHLAESPSLAERKHSAEMICRNALPEVSWVKIEDQDSATVFYWSAGTYGAGEKVLLDAVSASKYVN